MTSPCSLVLPLPPSVNGYWTRCRYKGKPSMKRTEAAKLYRVRCAMALVVQKPPSYGESLLVAVLFLHSHKGKIEGDIDNYSKGLFDALEHAGVYKNDSQIIELQTAKRAPMPGAGLVLQLREATEKEIEQYNQIEPELEACALCNRSNQYGWE